jgi:low affinity Fe/Cu permease
LTSLHPHSPHRPSLFTSFANFTAKACGHPFAFALAVIVIVIWAILGPVFGYSDTWQLVINTGTTIVTFLMVFLIQNTQNRDSHAMHVKLDEIIRALDGAHNALLNLEDLGDQELDQIRSRYIKLAEKAQAAIERGELDTACAEIGDLGEAAEQAMGTADDPARRETKSAGTGRNRKTG